LNLIDSIEKSNVKFIGYGALRSCPKQNKTAPLYSNPVFFLKSVKN
jgi:hypothetical protein